MADANAVIAGRSYLVKSAPHAASNALPANTLDYGAAWPAPWVDRGYTNGGLAIAMNLTRGEIRVDQEFDPVTRPVTGRNITISTNLVEMSAVHLQLASGMGTVATIAPAAGVRGQTELTIGSTLTELYNSWAYDILQPDNMAFRVIAFKGLATGSPSPRFTPDAPADIALEISALVDTSTTPSRVAAVRDVLPAI